MGSAEMSAMGSKLRTLEGGSVGFWCPGCEGMHVVRISTSQDNWSFNGNGDKPTFQPSVLITSYQWNPPVTLENLETFNRAPWEQHKVARVCHSFVTDGRIQFLGDCTHSLVGQTVDLPDFP